MALTDTRLRNLRSIGTRFELPDRDGLSLRVSQRGKMTWAVSFRVQGAGGTAGVRVHNLAGNKSRLTLGEYPTLSLAEAREKALHVKRLARAGTSPSDNLRAQKAAVLTVKNLFDRYRTLHLGRIHRTGANVNLLLERHVIPVWGERQLHSIDRRDLINLMEDVRLVRKVNFTDLRGRSQEAHRGGPGAAAEVRKWTRAMFQFGVEHSYLSNNPLAGVRNRDKPIRRDHVLNMAELRALWRAAVKLEYPWGPFFQLLILTGNRRGEWANAQSAWLESEYMTLEIPASDYKTGKSQVIPLSRQAAEIFRLLPKQRLGPYIFSSTGGTHPISGFSKAKVHLDQLIEQEVEGGIRHWVVHDLRRSMATHMERIGIEPHIIEVCLGHTLRGVAGVYRHYTYLPEKTQALQKWADELAITLRARGVAVEIHTS